MSWRTLWPLPALALSLLLPWLGWLPPFWVTLGNYIGIAAVVAIGLVVLTGVGGITSFGQASFVGFGAYTTAILATGWGVSPWLALPAALGVSALAALLIGAVTLRLSGHYLAVGTIAWSVSLYYTFANLDLFGRNDGITAIPPLAIGSLRLIDGRLYFSVIWIGVVLAVLATCNLLDSRVGRAIRSLRGGALAAASFGVNTLRMRMLAFVYAAVLAGFAGWLYAHMQRAVNPTPFSLNAGIEYLLMAVVGGAAHVPGAVLGAALVTLVNDLLQDLLPKIIGAQGNYESIVFGAILVLALQTSPEGLWPHVVRVAPKHHPVRPDAALLPRRAMPARGAPVRGRRDRRPDRAERRRQDHHVQPADRGRPAERGRRGVPRPEAGGHDGAGDRPARHCPHLPAGAAGGEHVGDRERGARRASARPRRFAQGRAAARPRRGGATLRRGGAPACARRAR
jgi:branched-chain amino acid transport system permease protein